MNNLPPGSRLGRFEIVGVLGEGAMGVVYLANDPEIERPVAVKTLRSSPPPDQAASEIETRFLQEAKLAGRLQHPNVVTIYEVGRSGDTFFIAMEFVEGEPLSRFAADRSLSLAGRVDLIRQVAHALQHAHERGVLHRDVKPGNILITRDRRVKVADFGIGKLLIGGTGDLTRTGQMLGSPAYMSPEQIRGEKLDGRSDLFSLGVVAYELLTGSRPFPGESITTLLYQILHTEPRDPTQLRADLPPATRGVFLRLLAKAPNLRPADAGEFLREMRKIEGELQDAEPTRAIAVPPPLPPSRVPAAVPPGPLPQVSSDPPADGARERAPMFRRPVGPGYLFGVAALLIALAIFLAIWKSTERRQERGASTASVATPVVVAPAPAVSPGAPAAEPPPPGVTELPTPGPASAADASVGAARTRRTRTAGPVPTQGEDREQPREPPTPVPPAAAAVEPPAPAPASTDNMYRTRRSVRFQSSPDQARVFVDDRYVGIADDWDDRGGGRVFELPGQGAHRVRLELPGHRTVNLDVLVTPSAEDDTVDIDDELERESRVAYPKLSSPTDRTVGPVEFVVDPREAVIFEGGRTLGPASSFGPGSPLRLPGPGVHDLVISSPGRLSRTVRILVAPNAERDVARVVVELKKTE